MFQHFTYQQFFSKKRRKNYRFSFYYHGLQYHGLYYYNGRIEWQDPIPDEADRGNFEHGVHDLMLFHVYDR